MGRVQMTPRLDPHTVLKWVVTAWAVGLFVGFMAGLALGVLRVSQ